jgi:hypothetical protein
MSSSTSFATEFDILKASHKFLREGQDAADPHNASWNDQLAQKYYDSLFREFALCDLKHYKSGNVALSTRHLKVPSADLSLIVVCTSLADGGGSALRGRGKHVRQRTLRAP